MLSFRNHAENEAGRQVPDLFFLFKKALNKALNEIKTGGWQLSFNIL